jgi:serine/threonine-protein kinase
MTIARAPVLAALLLAVAAPAVAQEWRSFTNDRFGTTADVPAAWRENPPPANGDGLSFTSPDGTATVAVYGGFQAFDTLAESVAILEAPLDGETITYRHTDRKAVVVSGLRGDTIFYRRSVLSCGDKIWNGVSIEYPAADKAKYDALVTHIARSLKPGPGYESEGCAD